VARPVARLYAISKPVAVIGAVGLFRDWPIRLRPSTYSGLRSGQALIGFVFLDLRAVSFS